MYIYTTIQRSHFCLVEIQNGTSLDHGIENTRMGSGQTGQPELDTGNRQGKTEELRARAAQLE